MSFLTPLFNCFRRCCSCSCDCNCNRCFNNRVRQAPRHARNEPTMVSFDFDSMGGISRALNALPKIPEITVVDSAVQLAHHDAKKARSNAYE